MKKYSKLLVILIWMIMMFLLVLSPLKAEWSPLTQLTRNAALNGWVSISGDGSKIVFRCFFDGEPEILGYYGDSGIFVVNSDGTGLQLLTPNITDVDIPSISDDGTKIAFTDNEVGGIFVVNSDGTELQQLTQRMGSPPSISGDGTKIVFSSYEFGGDEIFVVNSDGTGLQQLTHNNTRDHDPSISDDGTKIVFSSYTNGNPSFSEIFVVNSDGTGLKRLTQSVPYNGWYNVSREPSISGDGSKIAFRSHTEGRHEIFVINSDGTGLQQLTHNSWSVGNPSISDDGSKVTFDSQKFSGGNNEIFVVNSDGTELQQLTHNTEYAGEPSISGDGTKIAFRSYMDGNSEIWLLSLDDTGPVTRLDYDAKWRNSDFIVNLTASDDVSGVAEIFYRINDGPQRTVGTDGQPTISLEGDNNKLDFWSVDCANNIGSTSVITSIKLDKTSPVIGEPTQYPIGDVQADQPVRISVDVSDNLSGVDNITLLYTTDNGILWNSLMMEYDTISSIYRATIPSEQTENRLVQYKIVASDKAGNTATKDNVTKYYSYTVIPEPEPETELEPEPEELDTPETPKIPEPETPEESEPETLETPLISTEVAIIVAITVASAIGVFCFYTLRKRHYVHKK